MIITNTNKINERQVLQDLEQSFPEVLNECYLTVIGDSGVNGAEYSVLLSSDGSDNLLKQSNKLRVPPFFTIESCTEINFAAFTSNIKILYVGKSF